MAVSHACSARTTCGGPPSASVGSASAIVPGTNDNPSSPARSARSVLRATRSGRSSTPTVRVPRPQVGQVPVRGQREVGVAAAEVDHPQRAVRQHPGLRGAPQHGVGGAQERVDLAALVAVGAEHGEQRVVGIDQPLPGAVVARVARARRRAGPRAAARRPSW